MVNMSSMRAKFKTKNLVSLDMKLLIEYVWSTLISNHDSWLLLSVDQTFSRVVVTEVSNISMVVNYWINVRDLHLYPLSSSSNFVFRVMLQQLSSIVCVCGWGGGGGGGGGGFFRVESEGTTIELEMQWYDDIIKWKHFLRYWPFVRGIHRWIPRTKASDAELVFYIFYLYLNKRLSKQSWGWWFETSSRSLWRHCNECHYLVSLLISLLMSYLIMVIIGITDMFMPMATTFEMQIYDFWS